MKNPFNTLFGRLSLMTVSLIVLVHITAMVLVDRERGQIDTGHAQRRRCSPCRPNTKAR